MPSLYKVGLKSQVPSTRNHHHPQKTETTAVRNLNNINIYHIENQRQLFNTQKYVSSVSSTSLISNTLSAC